MKFREAHIKDVDSIMDVRLSVLENQLSDPSSITADDCKEFLHTRGHAWVCEVESSIVGFAMIDMTNHNVWALFVRPEYERMGIGLTLHNMMINWYFDNHTEQLWLSTSPETRAYNFYRRLGWKNVGKYGEVEIKLEMAHQDWERKRLEFQ